jgi:hypothetical protein
VNPSQTCATMARPASASTSPAQTARRVGWPRPKRSHRAITSGAVNSISSDTLIGSREIDRKYSAWVAAMPRIP